MTQPGSPETGSPPAAQPLAERSLAEQVWEALSPSDQRFLSGLQADACALVPGASPSPPLALVGGAVRDALLGVASAAPDLDIVLDTSGGLTVQALAQRYSERTALPHTYHPRFDNATLSLPDGRSADLIRARREAYPTPGARPMVSVGTLNDDLKRRDFSVNALALLLGGSPQLLDPTGGVTDLRERRLRPLHPASLHEDASRLVRAARLAGRLGLSAHPELLRQVPSALAAAEHTPRLWAELGLLLHEPSPTQAARCLETWGAGALLPGGLLAVWDRLDEALPPGMPTDGREPAKHEAAKLYAAELYAAALLHAAEQPAQWQERLGLGTGPGRLLERARSAQAYPAASPERTLRRALFPERPDYEPLQGRDLLAAGWTPGPEVGRALAYLGALRSAGRVRSQDEEWAALRGWKAPSRDP